MHHFFCFLPARLCLSQRNAHTHDHLFIERASWRSRLSGEKFWSPPPPEKKNERDGKRWINKNKPPEDEKKKKKGRRRVDRRSSRKKKKERETLPTPRVSPSVGRRWRSRAHSTDKCLQERSYTYSPLLYLSFFSLFLSSLPLSLSLNILSTTVLFCCVRMQVQSCGIHI